jgi:hypothetical protein
MIKNFTYLRTISVRFPLIFRNSFILSLVILSITSTKAGNKLPIFSTDVTISSIGHNLMISWQANKADYTYYEVQKSADGVKFSTIGLVLDAPENSNICLFKDKNAAGDCKTVWYRIRAIDNNGQYSYSNSTTFECIAKAAKISTNATAAYPNPFNGSTTLKFTSTEAGFVQVSIQDLHGKILLSKQSEIIKGENSMQLEEMKNFTRGIYVARLTIHGSFAGSQKLIRN